MRLVGFFIMAFSLPQAVWAGGIEKMSATSFPALPCSDGWSGCVVDETELSPQMVEDAVGRPHAADMRFGFFDLAPLPAASPFVELSDYASAPINEPVRAPVREERIDKRPEQVAKVNDNRAKDERKVALEAPPALDDSPEEWETASVDEQPDVFTNSAETVEKVAFVAEEPEIVAAPEQVEEPAAAEVEANDNYTTVEEAAPEVEMVAEVEAPPETTARSVDESPASEARQVAASTEDDAVAMAAVEPTGTASIESCDDLVPLQAPAMVGQLGVGRRACLEQRLSGAGSQTDKDKISRVLIIDAEYRGDRADWERLVKRHLNEISRSDPDLCLSYAHYLSSTKRYTSVIKWSEYALENKQKWSGNAYVKKVNSL